MKKAFAVILVLVTLMFAVSAFSAEVFAPARNGVGSIGTSSKMWGNGYFTSLNNSRISVASKDWGNATGTWTLSATEKEARIIYSKDASPSGAVIIGPSEAGRIYTIYNNGGQTITFQKSGGTGISIAARNAVTVAYFQISSATTDYRAIASLAFPTP